MSKIGDLFVQLGLKKDEFSKGLKDAKKETSSFANAFQAISSKGKLAFAAVGAAIAGVIGAIKGLAEQNQALGDAWERMVASMTAKWDAFKTAVASMDFTNLFSNMREAGNLAKELYDARDALGEIGTSYNISLARQLKTINGLKAELRDMTLSEEDRIKAGERLLAIYEKLEKDPTRGLANVSEKTMNRMAQKLGFNLRGASQESLKATRQQVEQFFLWLGTEAGESWNSAYAGASDEYQRQFLDWQARQAKLPENYARMLRNYQSRVGDKDRKEMEKAVTDYYKQDAQYSAETLRIQTAISSLRAKDKDKDKPPEMPTAPAEDPRIKEAERVLQRLDAYGKSELQLLQEKYQQEKALLEAFGIDTTVLAEEYAANVKKIIDVPLIDNKLEDMMKDMEGLEFELDLEDDPVAQFIQKWEGDIQRMKDLLAEFRDAAILGFSDAVQELADQFAGLEEINPGKVVQALLTPLADMAIKEGEILIAQGVGVEACKKALEELNGPVAIAAGAALVAIGAAAKSGLQSLARSGAGATATTTYGGASAGNQVQTIQTEMTVYVTGRLSGSDILLSGQKTQSNWNR